MNYKVVVVTSLLLMGAGCASTSATNYQTNTSTASSALTPSTGEASNTVLPTEKELLPKNKSWQRVVIKNYDHPYSVEIHPWWFWRSTKKEIDAGGAVFVSNAKLLVDGGRDASGTKIVWYGSEGKGGETFENVVSTAMIKECDVLRKNVNGFEVCAGAVSDRDSFTRAIAFKKDGTYVWQPVLDYGMPFESGLGYFLHMLETFKAESKENVTK